MKAASVKFCVSIINLSNIYNLIEGVSMISCFNQYSVLINIYSIQINDIFGFKLNSWWSKFTMKDKNLEINYWKINISRLLFSNHMGCNFITVTPKKTYAFKLNFNAHIFKINRCDLEEDYLYGAFV